MAKKGTNADVGKSEGGSDDVQDNAPSGDLLVEQGSDALPPGSDDTGQIEDDAGEVKPQEAEPDPAPVPAPAAKPSAGGKVKALVLRTCDFGETGEVALLDKAAAKTGAEQGALDLNPAAIAAAEA